MPLWMDTASDFEQYYILVLQKWQEGINTIFEETHQMTTKLMHLKTEPRTKVSTSLIHSTYA